MKKELSEIFNITNKCIVLTTPLILYSLISNIYLTFSATGKMINLIIAIVLFILMTAAFIAGWFNMIKYAINLKNYNNTDILLKQFLPGVGEYFLPSIGCLINIFLFIICILIISFAIGAKTIGDPNISTQALSNALETSAALKAFLSTLSTEQLNKLNQWNIFIMSTISFSYFMLMLYLPALFYKNKNPLIAFGINFKNLFSKHFLKTLGLFIGIFIVNMFISIFSAIFNNNIILHLIMTLINFYFITIACISLFYYYNKNFIESEIGKNIDIEL